VWPRGHHVDSRVADWLLALALCAVALVQCSAREPHDLWRVPSVLGTTLLLAWRRRAPLASHLLQVASAILGLQQPVSASLVALFVGLYSVAVYSRWRYSMLLPVIGAATLAYFVPHSYQWMPA